jgi:exopolysaccharide production protein ExoZ
MEADRIAALDFQRGLAISAVIAFHLSLFFGPRNSLLWLVCSQGFHGVQLFFLVSSLTMCEMWARRSNEPNPAVKFYIRRISRIAGPFWLAIIFYRLLDGFGPSFWAPDGISARQIITTALFVHTFWPDTINCVVPGGWSIGIEMLFYLFFPFLISMRGSPRDYVCLAFAIYLVNLILVRPAYEAALSDFAQQELVSEFLFLQFFSQGPVFLLGMALYKCLAGAKLGLASIVTITLWIALAFVLKDVFHQGSPYFYFWLGIFGTAMLSYFIMTYGISWAPLNALGQVSYSVYLAHFAIIDAVKFGFTLFGLNLETYLSFFVAASVVTCSCWLVGLLLRRFIEKPSSSVGRWVISKIPRVSIVSAE